MPLEKVDAGSPAMPRGTETVLIAEDDSAIRKLIVDILEPLGYRVVAARSGAEAVRLAETSRTGVDLLLTDVVMPGMGEGAGPDVSVDLSVYQGALHVRIY